MGTTGKKKPIDLNELNGKFLKMDGYDDCVCGVVTRFGQEPILCYDKSKVIAKLMTDGMTEDEANEFFEYNQIGAGMGELTPCFIEPLKNWK